MTRRKCKFVALCGKVLAGVIKCRACTWKSTARGHQVQSAPVWALIYYFRVSVPRRSCLGYIHAGCLQLSHRRPPEMCGLWTRPRRTQMRRDFWIELPSGGGHIVSLPPGRYLVNYIKLTRLLTSCCWSRVSATLSCPMKLHYYPLDVQSCPMMFESCE